MIDPDRLNNRMVEPARNAPQRDTVTKLVNAYLDVAHELPSSGWLARRMKISRQRAYEHLSRYRRAYDR